jgi:integrase
MKADIMDVALFKDHLLNEKIIARSTARAYAIVLGGFLTTNPDIDSPNDYNDYIIEKSFRNRSFYTYYALLAYVKFKFKNDKATKENIIESLRKPRMPIGIKRERRNLSDEKVLEIIANLKEPKHQIIALIQKLTGVRAGDIIRIPDGNILSEKYKGKEILRLAIIGKGGRRNVVEIFDETAQKVIKNYIKNPGKWTIDGYYFMEFSKKRKRVSSKDPFDLYLANYNQYFYDLKQALNGAGIMKEEWATHDFRRDFARKVWIKYNNLQILQSIMNHTDPKTTMRYLVQEGLKNIEVYKEMQENE